MMDKDFTIECPCCEAKILVDHKTGTVLSHEEPASGKRLSTFEDAFKNDQKRKSEAEDRFAQAIREHENREELLEKKFKEAFAKAEKDDSPPPPRPIDLD